MLVTDQDRVVVGTKEYDRNTSPFLRLVAIGWLCLGAAACGDNLADVDGAHSGTRLKLRWFEREDGLRQWEAEPGLTIRDGQQTNGEVFYDEELGTMCSAEPWADGIIRCTPPVQETDRALFDDPACTVGLSQNPDKFKFVADLDVKCNERQIVRVYPVTRTMKPQTVYFKDADGRCVAGSWDDSELGVLGDAMSPDTFATIVTSTSHDDERVQVRYHQSDDGMRLPIGLEDELLGSAVLSQMYAIPDRTGQDWYWTDENCRGTTVVRVQAGCPAPLSAYSWPNGNGRYSRVAERVTSTTVYRDTERGCAAVPIDNSELYRIIDEQLPIADMVTTPDADPDRRIQVVSASTGTRRARTGLMLDTAYGDCAFYKFPDGVYRCAPLRNGAAHASELFSDSTCQTSIELAWIGFILNGYQSSTLMLDDFTQPDVVTIRDISERYDGPLYQLQNQQCIPYAYDSDWRRVGRLVDWSELARAELVTD